MRNEGMEVIGDFWEIKIEPTTLSFLFHLIFHYLFI